MHYATIKYQTPKKIADLDYPKKNLNLQKIKQKLKTKQNYQQTCSDKLNSFFICITVQLQKQIE